MVLINAEDYEYATNSAYSPTISELPLKGRFHHERGEGHFLTRDGTDIVR